MKTLRNILLPVIAGFLLAFVGCKPDDSVNYGRLLELEKRYYKLHDLQEARRVFEPILSGEETEGYKFMADELVYQIDSIRDLLPEGFKEKADSLYEEVFKD